MKTIEGESQRVKNIIRNLLDFSRQRKSEKKPDDVNQVLKETISLMAHTAKNSNVLIEITTKEDLPPLNIDRNQVKQVFINLIGNSIQAMPEGGKLSIDTELIMENESEMGFAVVSFKDNGCGIPESNTGKVFDPFFSSKGEKGTGLGLSVSYGIIKNHGGDIRVSSKEGEGTEFTVILPFTINKSG